MTGWKGVNCSVMEEEECPEGWSGEFCDVCEEDVFGAMCKEDCDVKGTCSGHGRCVDYSEARLSETCLSAAPLTSCRCG